MFVGQDVITVLLLFPQEGILRLMLYIPGKLNIKSKPLPREYPDNEFITTR